MAEQTTNFGLHKPGTEDFYDVGVFNENADLIDGILKEHETALEGKAVDDFTHIPLALCETAGDAAEKEITIPGYTEEKYPIIAVKFANSNTDPAMKLSVNGGDALPVSTGNEISQWVGPETYPMSKGAVVLLSKRGNGRAWSVVGTHNAATDHNYGVVKLINSPDKPGYTTNRDVTTPSFVNTLFNRTLSNYQDAATYPVNALVMQDGAIYKSLQDDNIGHAVAESEWWTQVSTDTASYTATVGTTWIGAAAPYTQTLTVTGLRTSDKQVHLTPDYSTTLATAQAQQEAWNLISKADVTADNQITFTCFSDAPGTEIPIKIEVIR